jgi:hypothetical protein
MIDGLIVDSEVTPIVFFYFYYRLNKLMVKQDKYFNLFTEGE